MVSNVADGRCSYVEVTLMQFHAPIVPAGAVLSSVARLRLAILPPGGSMIMIDVAEADLVLQWRTRRALCASS